MTVLIVESHGPLVVASNYWDLPETALGQVYVSLNAGAVRVLLPPSFEPALEEMRGAEGCALSRGPWPDRSVAAAAEILFDDGSSAPYQITLAITPAHFDRIPPDSEAGGKYVLTCWTRPRRRRPHLALQRPCYYRLATVIPYLRPWREPGNR